MILFATSIAPTPRCERARLRIGKTSRRTHNRRTGHKALHLVSAFATNSRLVLGQEAVFEKSNEITAIPALIARLDLKGALVSPADAPRRDRKLFRNRAGSRSREGRDHRQGPRPFRGSQLQRLPSG